VLRSGVLDDPIISFHSPWIVIHWQIVAASIVRAAMRRRMKIM